MGILRTIRLLETFEDRSIIRRDRRPADRCSKPEAQTGFQPAVGGRTIGAVEIEGPAEQGRRQDRYGRARICVIEPVAALHRQSKAVAVVQLPGPADAAAYIEPAVGGSEIARDNY